MSSAENTVTAAYREEKLLANIAGNEYDITPATMEEKLLANITGAEYDVAAVTRKQKLLEEIAGSGLIRPEGEISITENGTYDVTEYASAEVSTPDHLAAAIDNSLTTYESDAVTSIRRDIFHGATNLEYISLPNATSMAAQAFSGCTKLGHVNLPKLSTLSGNSQFDGAKVTVIALPSIAAKLPSAFLQNNTTLTAVDLGPNAIALQSTCFYGAHSLAAVVLRKSDSILTMENSPTQVFGDTPFKSGGTGGTIYIPKALYDHLGDGTALDYKAGTNWSVLDGYGTVTWEKIEGSIYETQYADGTPIT